MFEYAGCGNGESVPVLDRGSVKKIVVFGSSHEVSREEVEEYVSSNIHNGTNWVWVSHGMDNEGDLYIPDWIATMPMLGDLIQVMNDCYIDGDFPNEEVTDNNGVVITLACESDKLVLIDLIE